VPCLHLHVNVHGGFQNVYIIVQRAMPLLMFLFKLKWEEDAGTCSQVLIKDRAATYSLGIIIHKPIQLILRSKLCLSSTFHILKNKFHETYVSRHGKHFYFKLNSTTGAYIGGVRRPPLRSISHNTISCPPN
jgi:hypothetical protein